MTFKCERCGAIKYPEKTYTSHGGFTIYYCPYGCDAVSYSVKQKENNLKDGGKEA